MVSISGTRYNSLRLPASNALSQTLSNSDMSEACLKHLVEFNKRYQTISGTCNSVKYTPTMLPADRRYMVELLKTSLTSLTSIYKFLDENCRSHLGPELVNDVGKRLKDLEKEIGELDGSEMSWQAFKAILAVIGGIAREGSKIITPVLKRMAPE